MMVLKLWNEISYGIVKGIYATVTKIYDLMLSLTDSMKGYDFTSFTESIYVVVGVFMLFRVAISLIQMLINPDQINDKQVGAGKLISRIVICIVLLLAFDPGSFLMKPNGWFARGEDAIIGPDGFLENFAPEANLSKDRTIDIRDDNSNIYSMSFGSNLLYENVYAKSNWSKTCYFYNKSHTSGTRVKDQGTTTCTASDRRLNKCNDSGPDVTTQNKVNQTYYRITFYSKNKKPDGAILVSSSAGIYATSSGGTEGGVKFTKAYLGLENNTLKSTAYVGNCSNWGYDSSNGQIRYNPSFNSIVFKGSNSVAGLVSGVKDDVSENPEFYKEFCKKNPDQCSDVVIDAVSKINSWLPYVSNEAVGFTTNVVSSFQDCSKKTDECKKAKAEQFGHNGADASEAQKNIVDFMDDDALSLDFIFSIIAGIALILFLILLCVDVVIRQFKLLLLGMIAPIPIICYADPKDKIFMSWLKMYFSVYVDLFIKLFAIKVVLILIAQLDNLDIEGIEYFFVIVGILVFAKLVPGMISKIFGLDSMGGSFKDIVGMGKKALSFGSAGVGLAAGAVVGAATAKGLGGKVLGGLKGAAMGAGSGYKGNILGGSKGIAASNERLNKQKAAGLNFFDRVRANAAGTIGGLPSGQKAEEQMKLASDVISKRNELDKWSGEELRKKGAQITAAGKVWKDKDGNVVQDNVISSKNGSRAVTTVNESIDMQTEYDRQNRLSNITINEWENMSPDDRKTNFGDLVGTQKTLTDANVLMKDRVAALEDYGKAERINIGKEEHDDEAIRIISDLNDSIANANEAGVTSIKAIPMGKNDKFDNKTLKKVKDQSNKAYNTIGEENAKAIKINKYSNSGK